MNKSQKRLTLTQHRLKQLVRYEPATGALWRISGQYAGCLCGSMTNSGYRQAVIDGVNHSVHRLVWLYIHGEFPAQVIHHANGNGLDNRIENLRAATQQQNLANRSAVNKHGFRGVTRRSDTGKFLARIRHGGNKIHIGAYDTAAEAGIHYAWASVNIYGEFATKVAT